MRIWLPLDFQADLIRKVFDPKAQMRLGVVMTDMGVVFCAMVFWTNEPPLIFELSALALLFAGIGTVVTAKLAEDSSTE